MRYRDAYTEGFLAAVDGLYRLDNPFKVGDLAWYQWREGYHIAISRGEAHPAIIRHYPGLGEAK